MDSLQIVISELELEKQKLLKIKQDKEEKQQEVAGKISEINKSINALTAHRNVLKLNREKKERTLQTAVNFRNQNFMFSLLNKGSNTLFIGTYEREIGDINSDIKNCSRAINREETKKKHYIEVYEQCQEAVDEIDQRVSSIDSEIESKVQPPSKQLILLPAAGGENE